jgi:hypothetical protein
MRQPKALQSGLKLGLNVPDIFDRPTGHKAAVAYVGRDSSEFSRKVLGSAPNRCYAVTQLSKSIVKFRRVAQFDSAKALSDNECLTPG